MKTVTLNVCQGVGDIFWVYQMFAPHVDSVNFVITMVPDGMTKVQARAVDFLKLLPKVGEVSCRTVPHHTNRYLTGGRFAVRPILEQVAAGHPGPFDFSCNKPLEEGTRLEAIEPDFTVEETVALKVEQCDLPFAAGNYLAVYLSGGTRDPGNVRSRRVWDVGRWAEFVRLFGRKYGMDKLPLVFVGASYDRDVNVELEQKLKRDGYATQALFDLPPAKLLWVLKNAGCFLGYQSGLNVLADQLDVKQVMLYFPDLRPMMYTWCKKKNLGSVFAASTFDRSPAAALQELNIRVGNPPPAQTHDLGRLRRYRTKRPFVQK